MYKICACGSWFDMFFVVRSNDSFNFPLGLIKYIVISNGTKTNKEMKSRSWWEKERWGERKDAKEKSGTVKRRRCMKLESQRERNQECLCRLKKQREVISVRKTSHEHRPEPLTAFLSRHASKYNVNELHQSSQVRLENSHAQTRALSLCQLIVH